MLIFDGEWIYHQLTPINLASNEPIRYYITPSSWLQRKTEDSKHYLSHSSASTRAITFINRSCDCDIKKQFSTNYIEFYSDLPKINLSNLLRLYRLSSHLYAAAMLTLAVLNVINLFLIELKSCSDRKRQNERMSAGVLKNILVVCSCWEKRGYFVLFLPSRGSTSWVHCFWRNPSGKTFYLRFKSSSWTLFYLLLLSRNNLFGLEPEIDIPT